MNIAKQTVIGSLSHKIPQTLAEPLVDEYIGIKQAFRLGHYSPTELSGGRFGEVIVRIFEYLRTGTFTAIGVQLRNTEAIINGFENDGNQDEFFRFFASKICRVLMGVRNKRNVAHLSNAIDPNYQDSLLVMELSTWLFSEIIRVFASMSIDDAAKLISSINYQYVPILEEIDGFPKILNTDLGYREKTLLLLYVKYPEWVSDRDLKDWTGYTNPTRFRTEYLEKFSNEALTHRKNNTSRLTSKGISEVEKSINLNKL